MLLCTHAAKAAQPSDIARASKCAHLNHLLVLIEPLGALLIFVSGDMPASMPVDICIIQLVTYTQTTLYRSPITPQVTPAFFDVSLVDA